MTEIDLALEKLNKQYCVIDTFYYSTLVNNDGEKILYDWLRRHYKNYFKPNERLVLVQDCGDIYEYNNDLGNYTTAIQKALKVIDITNCFVTILTTNKNIAKELALVTDTDVINHVIVPG